MKHIDDSIYTNLGSVVGMMGNIE